jgi:hypothetical protein
MKAETVFQESKEYFPIHISKMVKKGHSGVSIWKFWLYVIHL